MRAPLRFVAVGDVMVDITMSGGGHRAAIALRPGGSAVNAARWAAACGAEATVVGRVGDDLAGRALRGFLADAGIGAELAIDPALPTGTFAIVDGAVRVDRGANAGSWEPPALPPADVVLVSGYLSADTVARVVERRAARLLALSVGRLRQLGPGVHDVVLANAREARALTGEDDPSAAAAKLAGRMRVACVTLGADGAVAVAPNGTARAQPPRRQQRTATGAGDAFAAAFLLALAGDALLHEALATGCEAGARAAAG